MSRDPLLHIGRRPPQKPTVSERPDWMQANPARIDRALSRALARPTGGWFVLGASESIGGRTPRRYVVDGQELVAFRDGQTLCVAPAACPHMGADLSAGCVTEGRLVCPWHGLTLGAEGHGTWRPFRAFDDGVLAWVQLMEAGQTPTDAPVIARRPKDASVSGVVETEGACEPEDVIANRLDPWHGVHYHPHSFARLALLDVSDDVLTLRVSYRVAGPVCVEVDATFHCPEARTITMTVVDGEGVGSVVETHATPIGKGRSRIVEATIATSERTGFRLARLGTRLLRPMIVRRAARLWVEDTAYAERRYLLRTRGEIRKRRLEAV
jgi:isorenieratene synthase